MHEELLVTIQETVENGTADKIARAAPRGSAKSSIISFLLPIWCAVYKKKHYIIIVSDTASQADDFLAAIKSEFEENELLINDFNNQQGIIWTNSDIILRNEIRIQALGVGKKIRGRRYRQYRPDLIVADDIENDENIMSADQRKKNFAWFTKALSKAGDERTDTFIIGTIIHYDSLLANILKNPIYNTRKYKAVITFSNSAKWDEWENLITNLEDEKRIETAKVYFEENKEEMLAGTDVLWPQKEDYYTLMVSKIADGPAAFSSEKQNEPLSDDERRFNLEWVQFYESSEIIGKDLFTVGFVDPSMGKAGGDFSAIITLGRDTNDQIYVLDADIQRRHPDLIIADVISKHRFFGYRIFGVEEVQFQEYFKDSMRIKLEELEREDKTLSLTVRGLRQHKDKILRIQSLQPDVKSGRIKFRRDQQVLIEQLVNFPSADHDDGPDALEGAMAMLGRRSSIAEYYKLLANAAKKPDIQSFVQNPNLQRIGN